VCGSERFTAAGTPCQNELGTMGVVKVKKGEKPGHCTRHGKERRKTQSGRDSRVPVLQTARCINRDKMVYWCFS
jgi:hypothetical protein